MFAEIVEQEKDQGRIEWRDRISLLKPLWLKGIFSFPFNSKWSQEVSKLQLKKPQLLLETFII